MMIYKAEKYDFLTVDSIMIETLIIDDRYTTEWELISYSDSIKNENNKIIIIKFISTDDVNHNVKYN